MCSQQDLNLKSSTIQNCIQQPGWAKILSSNVFVMKRLTDAIDEKFWELVNAQLVSCNFTTEWTTCIVPHCSFVFLPTVSTNRETNAEGGAVVFEDDNDYGDDDDDDANEDSDNDDYSDDDDDDANEDYDNDGAVVSDG